MRQAEPARQLTMSNNTLQRITVDDYRGRTVEIVFIRSDYKDADYSVSVRFEGAPGVWGRDLKIIEREGLASVALKDDKPFTVMSFPVEEHVAARLAAVRGHAQRDGRKVTA